MKKYGLLGAGLCAVFIAAALPHQKTENYPLPACKTKSGLEVSYRRENGSMAGPLYSIIELNRVTGKPEAFIYYDGIDLDKYSASQRAFAFAHECAHHTLGHSQQHLQFNLTYIETPFPTGLAKAWEKQADCEAARALRKKGYSLISIRHAMSPLLPTQNRDYRYHDPGKARIARAMTCLMR